MPIDVTKIKPEVNRDEVIDNIVNDLFKKEMVSDSIPESNPSHKQALKDSLAQPEGGKSAITKDSVETIKNTGGRQQGFWNTYFGDMLERLGAGVYDLNGGLWSIGDKVDKLLTAIDPSAKFIKKLLQEYHHKHNPDQKYKTIFEQQRDYANDYADVLRERSDRYEGKQYDNLWSEGDYPGALGEIFLTATESVPQSALAMTGGGVGLALTGAVAGAQKYDQLDEMPETKEMPEYLKAVNSVSAGVFEAMFEKLGDAKIGNELVKIYSKMGRDQGKKLIEDGISAWMSKQFKKYGLLFMPVAEGIEEVGTQIANNVTDYCTGVTKEWNPLDGAGDSFIYGAMGGAQFALAGTPGTAWNKYGKYKTKQDYNKTKEELRTQFPDDDIETFANGLTFMSPVEQEAVLASMARDGSLSESQIKAVVSFARKAQKYRDYHTRVAREQDKEAIKELKIQTALREYDQSVSPVTNEDGLIQEVILAGMDESPVAIVKGHIATHAEGNEIQADPANSSDELYYKDKEGKMQVVSPSEIVRIISITDATVMRQNLEAGLRQSISEAQSEDQQTEQPISKDRELENGDKIKYTSENGEAITGTVADAFSNNEYIFTEDGTAVPRKEIIKIREEINNGQPHVNDESFESPVPDQNNESSYEIEKGLTATKQVDGSFLLNMVFTKSELDKGKKLIDRLNQDYADEGLLWELKELPKTDTNNKLEKKRYNIIGHIIDTDTSPGVTPAYENSMETNPPAESEYTPKSPPQSPRNHFIDDVLLKQYHEIKNQHPDTHIIFSRDGKNIALFEDAEYIGQIDGVKIKKSADVNYVIVKQLDQTVQKIVQSGQRVAVVEKLDKDHISLTTKNRNVSKKTKQDQSVVSKEIDATESAGNEEAANTSNFGSKNTIITRQRYDELKRQWLEKTKGQLNTGFDPELLSIGTQMAMFHIEAGARKFTDFAKSMIEDIGENIKPYLKAIYEGAKYMPGMENFAKDMDNSDFISNFKQDSLSDEESVISEKVRQKYDEAKHELAGLKEKQKLAEKIGNGFVYDKDIVYISNYINRLDERFGKEKFESRENAREYNTSLDKVDKEKQNYSELSDGKYENEVSNQTGQQEEKLKKPAKPKSNSKENKDTITHVQYPVQSYSIEGIGADYPNQQVEKWVKKDAITFVRALNEVLGWEYDSNSKGKKEILRVNLHPAGGDVSFILWKPDTDVGISVKIDYDCDYSNEHGYDNYRPNTKFLWRVTTKADKWRGSQNFYASLDSTSGELAELFNKAVDEYLKKQVKRSDNERQNSDRSLPDTGSENKSAVDDGIPTAGVIPDVPGRSVESIPDQDSRQSNGHTGSRNESRSEQDRSTGNNEQSDSLPDEGRTENQTATFKPETNRGNRGISESASDVRNSRNYVIPDPLHITPGGETAKIQANIAAIRLLKKIESEDRPATKEEQKKLSQYSGWGGLAEVLNKGKGENVNWEEKYGKYHREILALLSEDEYISAVNSTITAYYSAGNIVKSLWALAERLGFRGGKVLEPAAGSGNFLGLMPSRLAQKSAITAYELDSITGHLLTHLYPDAHVKVAGYESSKDRSFDLIITNVPFGQAAPYDPVNKDLSKFSLHNYFIAKGIKQLKPSGLGIFITSYSSLDNGASAKFREWVTGEGNADLIGAIRLPNNAFSNNAGTQVTTDVLVIRKRDANGISPYAQPFRYAMPYKEAIKQDGTPITIDVNEYYIEHPDMMIGEIKLAYEVNKGGLYSANDVTLQARKDENLDEALNEAIQKFTSNISDTDAVIDKTIKTAENNDKEGTLIYRDGEIREVVNGELIVPEWIRENTATLNGKKVSKREVARHYIRIREIIDRLVEGELNDRDDIEQVRKELNEQYDAFVSTYGRFYNNLKLRFISDSDINWCNVFALEKVDARHIEDGKGKLKREYSVTKADIFTKRVSFPVSEPLSASSLEDSINVSVAYRGKLDLAYIAKLLDITQDMAKERILNEGWGFENPVTGLIEEKDTYLSGFVRQKLAEAKESAKSDERFIANVKALEKVIPPDIPPSLIRFRLGTPFVPGEYIEKFIKDKLNVTATVRYIPSANRWIVSNISGTSSTQNKTIFATERLSGLDLIIKSLNMQQPIVYDIWMDQGKKVREKNLEETAAAQAKMVEIEGEFIDYIANNNVFINEIARKYNDEYNGYIEKKYSTPSFTHYPNANPEITLRDHQRKAIPRILQNCTLLAHQVGSGKTFTMITAAMEMRRLKTAKKPMIVVQNQTVEQFVSSFKLLYPGAKILSPTKKQMDAKNRKRLFNLISYGDYDAIIVPQSFISMIPDNQERQKAYIKEQISQLESVLNEVDPEDEKTLYSQLTAQLTNFEDALSDLDAEKTLGKTEKVKNKAKRQLGIVKKITSLADRRVDNVRTFEQLGVDALFVDEAHAYKKLGLVTKLANVRGIDKGGSKRAFSIYMKVRHIQETTGGKNVIFATGTPITNTMAELWTMLRYIGPDILAKYHMELFDEFASTFGTIEPSLEFTATGSFKIVDRFKSYVNTPELINGFRAVADVVLTEDIREFKESNTIPKLKDGQFTQVIIKQSDALKTVMAALRKQLEEWEKLPGREKRKQRHIPLVVFNKAKQAAIDLRLLNPHFEDDPGSKTNRVVEEVFRIYQATTDFKGTQLVFSDMYQSPDQGSGYARFNLYHDIKNKLVAKGIPEQEIAIINEYNDVRREVLFEQVNNGDVRILIGGTEKMGVGVNVQQRLAAVHHIDAPPRPMDFEQRNGRIIRQGNMLAIMGIPVEILTYGVEKTLDATAYQRLLIKQHFINQMMKGESLGREIEDCADEDNASDLNFGQMMATLSGSQYAILHQQKSYDLKKLEMAEKNHARRLIELNNELKNAFSKKEYYKEQLAIKKEQSEIIGKYFPAGKITFLQIRNKIYTEKLSEVLEKYFQEIRDQSIKKATYMSYSFYINGHLNPVKIQLIDILHPDLISYEFLVTNNKESQISSDVRTAQGFLSSFSSYINHVSNDIVNIVAKEKANNEQIPVLEEELKKPFDKAEKLEALRVEVADLEEKMQKEVIETVNTDNHTPKEKEDISSSEEPEEFSTVTEPEPIVFHQNQQNKAPVNTNTDVSTENEIAHPAKLALPVKQTRHTKTGADLFVVQLGYQLEKDKFINLKKTARKYNGNWSNFTKGFNFNTTEDAEYFREEINDTSDIISDPLFRDFIKQNISKRNNLIHEVEKMKRALGIDFEVVYNRGNLPSDIFKKMNEDRRYPGVFVPSSGKAYIVLDELVNVEDARRSILHEVAGHKGIHGLFGTNLTSFIEKVLKSLDKPERDKWLKQYKGNRILAAQEYVASFAEGYIEPTQWNRIRAIVKNYFRRMGIDLKLTDKDLMYLLWKGIRQIQNTSSLLEVAEHSVKDNAMFKESEYDITIDTASDLEIDNIDKVKLHNEFISRKFRFLEAYQDRMLAVKKMQVLIEQKIGRKLPDYMDAYLYENTLASRNTYETEFFRNNLLRPLTAAIAKLESRNLSRQDIENYVILKHGLERNEYMRKREVGQWYVRMANEIARTRQEDGEDVFNEKMRELDEERGSRLEELQNKDYAGIDVIADELADGDIGAFLSEVENRYPEEVDELWRCIKAASEFSLKKWFDSGMLSKSRYNHIRAMYRNYIPLRGFDETLASDVYEYFNQADTSFNSPLRFARGRRSKSDSPFAYLASMAESAVTGGNKNLMKLHLYRLAQKYPSGLMSINKVWYEDSGHLDEDGQPLYEVVFPVYDENIEKYRKNIEDFNSRMTKLEKEGKAYTSRNILKVGLRMLNSEPNEHVVRVRLNGEDFAILVHGDPRIAQAVNGLNDEERTDNKVIKAIRMMNRQMAANFTTRNPAFVISNLTRDLIFSLSTLSVKENARYRNLFFRNIGMASGAITRYLQGKAKLSTPADALFQEFLQNGGETGYTALHNIEKYKKLIDREVKGMKNGKLVKAGKSILEFFEVGNRWAEDLSRFSVYVTSRESGRSVLRSVADAKEVTVNFNRKGSGALGAQTFKSLYLFFNAAVQSLANCTDMILTHPVRTTRMLAGYAAAGAIVPLLLMALDGDDALEEYLNLPDYVRKNNFCIFLGTGHGFITVPLPIELRAFFGWGDAAFRYMVGDVDGVTASGEVVMGMLDLLPLNPAGSDTPFVPDAIKPLSQSFYTNRDFTGRPIAKVTEYNGYVPEYQRAYKGTGEFFIKSSEVLNTFTGGDYATRGAFDEAGRVLSNVFNANVSVTNPAAIEHLFEAYLGGLFITINQGLKTVETGLEWAVTGNNPMQSRNIPILNRFYNSGSLYSSQAKMNQKYFDALDEMRKTQSRIQRYKDAMSNGKMDIDNALDGYLKIVNDGSVERLEVIKFYSGEINKINDNLSGRGLSDQEVDKLITEQYLLKQMMLEELKKVDNRVRTEK